MIVPLRLGMLTAVVQPGVLPAVLPVLGGGLLAGGIISFVAWRQLGSRNGLFELELRNPTELRTAVTFGLVYGVVLLCSAALSDYAGTAGLYVVALISGLTDVDAITLSSLHLFGQGKLVAGEAATAILIAMLANLGFKLGIVSVVGGRTLVRGALAGFIGLAGGSLAGWALWRLF